MAAGHIILVLNECSDYVTSLTTSGMSGMTARFAPECGELWKAAGGAAQQWTKTFVEVCSFSLSSPKYLPSVSTIHNPFNR